MWTESKWEKLCRVMKPLEWLIGAIGGGLILTMPIWMIALGII